MAFRLPSDERGASCLSSETACEFASSGDKADISMISGAFNCQNPGQIPGNPGYWRESEKLFFLLECDTGGAL